jgi:hypothetical protein
MFHSERSTRILNARVDATGIPNMNRTFAVSLVLAAIATAGFPMAVHAVTPSQSGSVAAKARADALARARAQAAAKAQIDALAKARTEATAKSKAFAITRQSVHVETQRRVEAAETAAQAQAQIKAASARLQGKAVGAERSAQSPPKTLSKPQVAQVQPLRSAMHQQHAQTLRPHSSSSKAQGQTSRSSAHAR